ncbi:MAG: DUF1573 domain-containing protein [Alistipes sp.]|nr:DUF1573 domain-containing protein [Alistipes senegalensis]MCM1250355.1 DUF1573 domain-containing protein [Alistipes sp.]
MMRLLVAFVLCFGAVACGSRTAVVGKAGRTIVLTDSLLACGGRDTVRFGRLRSGEIGVSHFRFENRTSRPLVIVSVERSCGCASLEFDAAPLVPGDFRPLALTFDTRGLQGWQLKVVNLIFAGEFRPFRLFVEADVE